MKSIGYLRCFHFSMHFVWSCSAAPAILSYISLFNFVESPHVNSSSTIPVKCWLYYIIKYISLYTMSNAKSDYFPLEYSLLEYLVFCSSLVNGIYHFSFLSFFSAQTYGRVSWVGCRLLVTLVPGRPLHAHDNYGCRIFICDSVRMCACIYIYLFLYVYVSVLTLK